MISSVKGNIKNAYAMAYHAVYYANGTKCDVTGYPRTAIAKVRAMAQASPNFCRKAGEKLWNEDKDCSSTLHIVLNPDPPSTLQEERGVEGGSGEYSTTFLYLRGISAT